MLKKVLIMAFFIEYLTTLFLGKKLILITSVKIHLKHYNLNINYC